MGETALRFATVMRALSRNDDAIADLKKALSLNPNENRKSQLESALRELGGADESAAVVGPGAGPCCYSVGSEVHTALTGAPREGPIDLRAIVRGRLNLRAPTALGFECAVRPPWRPGTLGSGLN